MTDQRKPFVVGAYYESSEDKQAFLRKVFDDTAKHYEAIAKWGWFGSGDWYRREALRRNGVTADMRVLDVASGTGQVARALMQILNKPEQIAVLRLDTDWYESTRCELEQLFPRLSEGGVLIIDDYGHWEGCRRAVDEYFADHQIDMFLHRIDYTGRIGIKSPRIPSETKNG